MDVVLNELSLSAQTEADLEDQLARLVDTLKRLFAHGATRVLRAVRDLMDRAVLGDVTLRRWLASGGKRRETKQFLQWLLHRAPPHVDDLLAVEEQRRSVQLEYKLGEAQALGLGLAHALDVPAASFAGDPCFRVPHVVLRAASLADDGDGTLLERDEPVVHMFSPESVDGHRGWLEERMKRDVKTGAELWARRAELFPRLDFCARVERQLTALSGREGHFAQVVRNLHVLSRTALDWTGGELDPPLDYSGESGPTMDRFTAERTFLCPDGERRVFELHAKLRAWNKRIHFLPVRETRRVLVGHVGDHLPTTMFR